MKTLSETYSVWLLSNTNPKHIRDAIEKRYLFPQLIDGAVYSFNVGYRKPETSIYRIAADNANVLTENCIFIDDQYENVQSAIRLGFTGIHFKSYQQLGMDLIQHKTKRGIVLKTLDGFILIEEAQLQGRNKAFGNSLCQQFSKFK